MRIFENYTRAEYEDYYDFKKNFRLQAPETFNFAYDVMDKLAEEKPDKVAMIWLGRSGEEKRFTFRDFSLLSNKAANFFAAQGIGKGDMVLLILKRRYEFWISMLALHKLGGDRDSRDAPAHQEGHRLPQQLCRCQGGHLRERG